MHLLKVSVGRAVKQKSGVFMTKALCGVPRCKVRHFEGILRMRKGLSTIPCIASWMMIWSSTSEAGKFELNRLLGNDHGFDTVKPTRLIKTLIASATALGRQDIVMDFFAGSGTTGEAVMSLNAEDGGNRRAVLVQLTRASRHREQSTKEVLPLTAIGSVSNGILENSSKNDCVESRQDSKARIRFFLSTSASVFSSWIPPTFGRGIPTRRTLKDRFSKASNTSNRIGASKTSSTNCY